jgi:large subunit ribosomal protein L3
MISGLLGRKVGMTQVFMPDGVLVPCTVIEVGPCPVIQMRTREQDGYEAVQIGFLPRARGTNKPLRGHFTKHNAQPLRHLRSH